MDLQNEQRPDRPDRLAQLLRADAEMAARDISTEQIRAAMSGLSPAIAAKTAELRLIRKARRDIAVMAAVGIPMIILMGFTAVSFLRGDPVPIRGILIPMGMVSGVTLLLLPVLEKFLSEEKGRGGRTVNNERSGHATAPTTT